MSHCNLYQKTEERCNTYNNNLDEEFEESYNKKTKEKRKYHTLETNLPVFNDNTEELRKRHKKKKKKKKHECDKNLNLYDTTDLMLSCNNLCQEKEHKRKKKHKHKKTKNIYEVVYPRQDNSNENVNNVSENKVCKKHKKKKSHKSDQKHEKKKRKKDHKGDENSWVICKSNNNESEKEVYKSDLNNSSSLLEIISLSSTHSNENISDNSESLLKMIGTDSFSLSSTHSNESLLEFLTETEIESQQNEKRIAKKKTHKPKTCENDTKEDTQRDMFSTETEKRTTKKKKRKLKTDEKGVKEELEIFTGNEREMYSQEAGETSSEQTSKRKIFDYNIKEERIAEKTYKHKTFENNIKEEYEVLTEKESETEQINTKKNKCKLETDENDVKEKLKIFAGNEREMYSQEARKRNSEKTLKRKSFDYNIKEERVKKKRRCSPESVKRENKLKMPVNVDSLSDKHLAVVEDIIKNIQENADTNKHDQLKYSVDTKRRKSVFTEQVWGSEKRPIANFDGDKKINYKKHVKDLLEQVKDNSELNSDEYCNISENFSVMLPWPVPPLHVIETRVFTLPTVEQKAQMADLGITIKNGMFTKTEDNIIKANFKEFCKTHDLPEDPEPFCRPNKSKAEVLARREKIKFVRFLAHNLPNRPLYVVYRRFLRLFKSSGQIGRFNPHEDKIILEYMKNTKNPRCNAELAKMLNRNRWSIEKRYKRLTRKSEEGAKILWDERKSKKLIRALIKSTNSSCAEDLRNKIITQDQWKQVSKLLNISVEKLCRAWHHTVYPRLYVKDSVYWDEIKLQLINILSDHDYDDWRTINWNEISKKFEGFTPRRLNKLLKQMVSYSVPGAIESDYKGCIKYLKEIVVEKYKFKKLGIKELVVKLDRIK